MDKTLLSNKTSGLRRIVISYTIPRPSFLVATSNYYLYSFRKKKFDSKLFLKLLFNIILLCTYEKCSNFFKKRLNLS